MGKINKSLIWKQYCERNMPNVHRLFGMCSPNVPPPFEKDDTVEYNDSHYFVDDCWFETSHATPRWFVSLINGPSRLECDECKMLDERTDSKETKERSVQIMGYETWWEPISHNNILGIPINNHYYDWADAQTKLNVANDIIEKQKKEIDLLRKIIMN